MRNIHLFLGSSKCHLWVDAQWALRKPVPRWRPPISVPPPHVLVIVRPQKPRQAKYELCSVGNNNPGESQINLPIICHLAHLSRASLPIDSLCAVPLLLLLNVRQNTGNEGQKSEMAEIGGMKKQNRGVERERGECHRKREKNNKNESKIGKKSQHL